MVDTIKFSQMPNVGNLENNDIVPSLRGGANVTLTDPWTFLPPGTTAQRPVPASTMYYRLRVNTDTQLYEYYDPIIPAWVQLQQSSFQGPFIIYEADSNIPDGQNLGLLSNGILKQTVSGASATLNIAVQGTDYYGPGDSATFSDITMTGNIDMGGFTAFNAANPVNPQDYATKFYVDQVSLTGTQVYAASAASLGTVSQVGSGPGATLTNSGVQAVFALDGVNPPVGSNVLIKNTATGMTAANEGIYTVTDAGSISTNWVLTRAANFDTAPQVNTTGLIVVQNGSTLAGTGWYNTTDIVTMDVTAFSFAQFGTGGTVTSVGSGTGLTGGPITTTGTLSVTGALASIFGLTTVSGNMIYTTASNTYATVTPVIGGVMVMGATTVPQWLANPGATGRALLSGNATIAAWSNFPPFTSVNVQTFSGSGTYTATSGLVAANALVMGGGGGSGGCASGAGSISSAAGGGGAAPLASGWFTAAQVGTGGTITIGAGGLAATAGANIGGTGGTSSIVFNGAGTLTLSSTGGIGGGGDTTGITIGGLGGTGGSVAGGILASIAGAGSGDHGCHSGILFAIGGKGADSAWGSGGLSQAVSNGSGSGNTGTGYGSGASGAVTSQAGSINVAGSAGQPGFGVVIEYICS